MNYCKCERTGKFLSKARVKFNKSLDVVRETSLVTALLLVVLATTIGVYL